MITKKFITHPEQITLTDIELRIGKLKISSKKKTRLLDIFSRVLKTAGTLEIGNNFWLKISIVKDLLELLKNKIIY
jgi:hypothetical protein